jgi:hypothetical protein
MSPFAHNIGIAKPQQNSPVDSVVENDYENPKLPNQSDIIANLPQELSLQVLSHDLSCQKEPKTS